MSHSAILDIDVGNTRLKWCLREAGAAAIYSACSGSEQEQQVELLAAAMVERGVTPGRVRVASVASDERNNRLHELLSQAFSVAPEFARTTAACDGLVNSYSEPGHMGVDRWLAMLAARREVLASSARALCVVDAGSALTLDFVAADGQHSGGYIVPGRQLQIDALLSRTGRVFAEAAPSGAGLAPADNTSDAVHKGVLASMVYAIEGACNVFKSDNPDAVIFVGGGDAPTLVPHLAIDIVEAPNLVLDGIPILLP